MRPGTRRRIALLLRALVWGLVAGAVFGGTTGSGFRDTPLPGAVLGVIAGAINGVAIAGVIFGAEIFLSPTRLGHALERMPFLVTFAMKVLVYVSPARTARISWWPSVFGMPMSLMRTVGLVVFRAAISSSAESALSMRSPSSTTKAGCSALSFSTASPSFPSVSR